MVDLDEPPPRNVSSKEISGDSEIGLKSVLLGPEKNQFIPPDGLKVRGKFRRKGMINPAVVQDDVNRNHITLFPRLIYEEDSEEKSCVLKRQGFLQGCRVSLTDDEEVIFQACSPHGVRGVEDFRAVKLVGEQPLHGFLVHFNGFDARTEYVRTCKENPSDYSKWEDFGIFFPNITAEEAISIVKLERYRTAWKANYSKQTLADAIAAGRKNLPEVPFLSGKDCCLLPRKVNLRDGEHYGVVIRLFPDIQIVYVKDFKELASHEFWRKVVGNLEEHLLLGRKFGWEKSHIGLAGPPLEVEEGILMDYHGVCMQPRRNYRGGRALLDKDNPQKVLARTRQPIYFATEDWEKNGIVDGDIVFPAGNAISEEGIVHSFYGAGDMYVGHVTTTKSRLMEGLETV